MNLFDFNMLFGCKFLKNLKMIKVIILADWMVSEISCIPSLPFRKIKDLIYGLWQIMQQFVFFRLVFTTS